MATAISELVWRRQEILREIVSECLSRDTTWKLGDFEDAWTMLVVASWTKDEKFVDYSVRDLTFNVYARKDVKATAADLAKMIEKLKGNKEFYHELASRARGTFYDLLIKCLAEKLPF
jgi:hypothetical protein